MKRGILILAFIIIGFLVWGTSFAWGSWQYAESEVETTTTSTSYVTKVQQVANSSGTYLILAAWELGINDTTAFVLSRVVHNTTTLGDYTLQTFDGSIRYRTFGFHSLLSLAAGDTIKITYATNNALYSARIKRARILLVPLTGMEYATGTGLNVLNLGTSWSNASSTAITPATEGDYLVIASVDTRPNSSVASGECRVDLDGSSTWDLMTMEGKSTSDRVPYFSARVIHLSASAHTLRLQARSDEGVATDIFSPRISVIRLSKNFNDFSQGEQLAEDSTTNGADNWVNRLTQVHHPFQPGAYLVLGSSFVKSLPDTSVIPEQRWTVGGQEENKFLGIMKDSTDFLSFVGFKVLNWNAAPETLKVDYSKYSSGSEWVHIRDARVMAISEQLWTGFPVLDSIGPKNVVEGNTLGFRLHAKDPDGDSIILSAVNIPSNAVLVDSGNGSGSFTFTPAFNQAGVYNITFIARDITAKADSEVVQITVNEWGNHPPELDSIKSKSLAEGDTLKLRIHATDLDLDSLILTASSVPTNAVYTDSGNGSGSLVFTPNFSQAGVYDVIFRAADTLGGVDSELVQITVNNVNRLPALEAIGSKNVNEGGNLSFRIHASDPDGDPLTLSAIDTPPNATFVDSGNGAGSFVFDPDYVQAGVYSVTFIAADTFLAADSEMVQITVNNVNRDPVLDPIGPQSLTEGDTLRLRIHATDPDLDSLVLSAVNIPLNAVFVDSGNGSGSLVFTPSFTQSGIYHVTFRSHDPWGGADSEAVQITVVEFGNHAPLLDSIGTKSLVEGDTLKFRIHATDLDEDPLTLSATNVPLHAVFVDSGNGSGSFVFDPNFTQSRIYNVTFKSTDSLGAVDSEVVQITVTEWGNHSPKLASIGAKSVSEGDTLKFNIHATDLDADSIILIASDVPTNVLFTDSGNGSGLFVFTPDFSQSGIYHVTFRASDALGGADSEIVQITVNNTNRVPVLASIGPKTVNEAQTLQFRISGTDPDGDSVHFSAVNVPTNTTLIDSGNGAGSFIFNPNYNQAGIYSVTFIASDRNLADSEVVSITVNNVNRAPDLAAIGPRSVIEGGHLGFLVTASDPDGDSLVLTVQNLPNHSSFVDSGNGKGSFKFDPDYTQSGIYYLTFKARDLSLTDSEVVQITVIEAGNQAPVLDSIGSKTIAEAETLSFRVHAVDPDGNNPVFLVRNNPTNSTLVDSGNGSGSFKFIPNYQQAGVFLVSFVTTDGVLQDSERVQITVTNTDRPPVLEAIGPKSVNEGDSLIFRVHSTDPDNDPVVLSAVNLPSHAGFADSGNGAGSFRFNPSYAQSGIYNVTFKASAGVLVDSEVVQITVNETGNHAPVLSSIGAKAVNEGQNLSFRIAASDIDLDSIRLTITGAPLHASLVDSGNGAGTFIFNPDYTQSGSYNVTFIASDGSLADSEIVPITVDNVDRPPVLDSIGAQTVKESETLTFRISALDPDGDGILLTARNLPVHASFTDSGNGTGSFTFTPDLNQSGIYYLTFVATAGALVDSEVVQLTVTNYDNRPPVLDAIGLQNLPEGGTLSLRIAAQDPDLDPIVLSVLDVPTNGTLVDSGNGAGSFIFTPDYTQSGIYNVTFIASDGFLADSEKVEITVTETGNHVPVLDSIGPKSVTEGGSLEFRIHASDVDKDPLFLQATNIPRNAAFEDSGNGIGSFVINPDFTQSGLYHVTFLVNDTSGTVDSEVVDISVIEAGNHAPVLASIGPKSVVEKNTLTFGLHATDLDLDHIVFSALNVPTHASLVDSGNGAGSFSFTPDSSQSGIYHVTFVASDASLADSEVVDITVTEWANHPPVLDSIGPRTIHEGDSLVFSVSASDSDGTIPVLAVSNLPDHATFVDYHNGHGLFRFHSTFYQAGIDTVTFEAIDMSNPPPLSDLEKVVITILDVNQAPAIDTIGPKTIQAGQTLRIRVVGHDPTDPDGGPLHMTAVDLPLNSAYHDSGGGVGGFTFTPDYSQAGVDTVTFFCTDEGTPPLSGFRKVEITVIQGADRAPVLDAIGFKMVTEGATLSFRVHATDPDGTTPILYTSLPLPQNATFVDSANGAGSFLFIPGYLQAGLYQITFYAGDGQLNDYEQVMIQVVEAGNQAPVLDSIGPQSILEGDSLKLRIHAVDPEGNPVTLSIRNNPTNSSLVDSGNGSGTFRFKPSFIQSGIYTVTFKATDSYGKPDSELVQITVIDAGNQPPVLDSIGPKTIAERQWLTFTVTAHDPEGNTPRLRAFGLPPSAYFTDLHNGAGQFSYTPSYYEQGIYQTRFEAVDSVDTLLRNWEIVQITVRDSNQFPTVSIFPDSTDINSFYSVYEGGTFMLKIIGTDPDSTIPIPHIRPLITNSTFIDSGNGVGLFTFRPGYNQGGYPSPRDYFDTAFVVDQYFPADTSWFGKPIRLRVFNVPEPPNILPINDTSIVEGQVLDIHVVTTSTVDMPTLKVLGQPLNSSFVDSGNGRGWFHFAPDFNQASVYLVRFVSKYGALGDTEDVNITVTEYGNHAPVLDSIKTRVVGEESILSFRVHATDLDHDAITLLTRSVPTNAVFVDSGNGTGSFVFHPNWQQAGQYYVTFIARDIYLAQDSEVVTITVEEVNQPPVLDSIGPKTIPEGSTLTFRVHGTDVDSDSLVLSATPLPTNATFRDSGNGAGAFTFTPNYHQSGTYNVFFMISDRNTFDMENVTITVTNVPQSPDLDSIGPKTVTEGDSLKLRIHATDPDGDPITLSIRNNPTNSSLVDSGNGSGTFRFRPNYLQAGVYLVTFKAADSTGRADSEVVQVTVNEAGNQRPDLLLPLPDSAKPAVGETMGRHVYAIDLDGSSITLTVAGLPRLSTFVDSGNGGGFFQFLPDSTQRDSVYLPIFIASDGLLADSVKLPIHVISYLRGDANSDGKVELGDLVFIINYLFKNGPAPVPLARGDANCDSLVNLGDIVYLINYLFKSGPPPVCINPY